MKNHSRYALRAALDLNTARNGHAVGLFGGSFDPPHAGHTHFAQEALKRFGLDQVIMLVSPGNPLKTRPPTPLETRVKQIRTRIESRDIGVSTIESQIGSQYTYELVRHLRAKHPYIRFVWLMGADNMVGFHNWAGWRSILESVPVGVLARPGYRLGARFSVAARSYAHARVKENHSRTLARLEAPAWCFANMPMRVESSTVLRAARREDPPN